jgi:Holliday junction DNA helicase RuvA
MIGWLSGILRDRGSDHILIDVGGVGYVVHVSDRTLQALPPLGETIALHTELLVREDLLQLFGFVTLVEREWHRVLTSVQGVGAKVSLAILGALGPDGVARAIAMGDAATLRAAPGVGPKLAQRIAVELRDKAPALMAASQAAPVAAPVPAPAGPRKGKPVASAPAAAPLNPAMPEAMSALANLGYAPADAARAVSEAQASAPDADTASLIRAALRLLAPKG